MYQTITPPRTIFHCGDTVTFRLEGVENLPGRAVVRTNLGRAAVHRAELVELNERQQPPAGLDWHDLELRFRGGGVWELTLPLLEIGVFEAKCCFIPNDHSPIRWPDGDNFRIKVESAAAVAANTIYSAFVRQFGTNLKRPSSPAIPESARELDAAGYTVIPPSGTFRALRGQLDHIFGELGCRILQLLPVHPAPVLYGRMGRYGSPFAALDYFAVDPALAEFDPKATPLEQFDELIDAVHAREGRIFMDIPVNHTGWASKLQNEHPEYFVRGADGTFESPGAWGVVWADLCKLDYRDAKVIRLMAKVFLFWCRRGVDGFRCDAGYMLPPEAWDYIVARVRQEFPDTVFLLEGLGGPLKVQERLLGSSGLNWGYSELFQNYTRDQISGYFPYVDRCSRDYGILVNFAETHDNNRLAASGEVYARLRFLVAALLSEDGAFGFANGSEFFATEKIDVHGAGALNWGHEPNLVGLIRRLNTLLAVHPAFHAGSRVELIQQGPGNVLAARRTPAAPAAGQLLVLLNLDCDRQERVYWPDTETGATGTDLLTGKSIVFDRHDGSFSHELAPGEGAAVVFDGFRLSESIPNREPERVARQRADAMARTLLVSFRGLDDECGVSPGREFLADPEKFIARAANLPVPPVTHWNEATDSRRRVMIPPCDALLVESTRRFRVEIRCAERTLAIETSLRAADGRNIAAFVLPAAENRQRRELTLKLVSFGDNEEVLRSEGALLQLPAGEDRRVRLAFSSAADQLGDRYAFAANSHGGVTLFQAAWGRLSSKYEAILSANVNSSYPVDRRTMFTRCRGWISVNGYSQELEVSSLLDFRADTGNRAKWRFALPGGQGCRVMLEINFEGALDGDAVRFQFHRPASRGRPGELEDSTPVRLILRPDLEDRVNHNVTKAFTGPEQRFPAAVRATATGFDFTPAERTLRLSCNCGRFQTEPEWYYMVDLPAERHYGLEDKTDLFSPGYFEIPLSGGETACLTASVHPAGTRRDRYQWPEQTAIAESVHPETLLESALRRYVVKRDAFSTVIAGYPWFLDWGRDTLIVLRGLAAGHFREEAAAIIRQFACFERNGTIPNMIRGLDDANRDTSDAPLYLIVAARDCVDAAGTTELLDADCGGRTLREVLRSIVENYLKGTPNGIAVDPESKLVFSPPHFTWMDTNFPAGTPREGYPIEIQSLWYAALAFLGREEEKYRLLAEEVQTAMENYFFPSSLNGASDCLHAPRGTGAAKAVPDDHIRPNQLLAVTLGAVTDPEKRKRILSSCEQLLVPGGIRSLADRPVSWKLPVEYDGRLLNDPAHPYRGRYEGPEDTSRKVAYHNGTVWCWPFPAYCEALYLIGGEGCRERALALLLSAAEYLETGVIGQLPEVADGDAPHREGGCPAQAWSESEFFRVYELLRKASV